MSRYNEQMEELDQYGRTIGVRRDFSQHHQYVGPPPSEDGRRGGGDRGNSRDRFVGNRLHRDRSNSRSRRLPSPHGYRGGPSSSGGGGSSYQGGGGFGGRGGGGGNYQDRYSNQGSANIHFQQRTNIIQSTTFKQQAPPDDRVNMSTIGPLLSFKNFIIRYPDQPPEVYQMMYSQYNLDYMQFYSDAFFNTVYGEEWFQDRYNPVNIQRIEKETETWSAEESARIRDDLLHRPAEFIAACSLDPSAKFNQHKLGVASSSSGEGVESLHNESVLTNDSGGGEGAMDVSEGVISPTSVSGKHLSGHENRTVYLSEIHACCPKTQFKEAIKVALTRNANPGDGGGGVNSNTNSMIPERVLIAQPVWSTKNIEKFDRAAWVIMPTHEAAKRAVELLKNLEITVFQPADPHREEPKIAFKFKIQSSLHSSRLLNSLPDFMSNSNRVHADIQRAMKLCSLLDEDRNVPENQRLISVLNQDSVIELIDNPTKHLDVCIAYLRRVHFLSFYAGKRFREESHLLAMSSSVVFRSKFFVPAPNEDKYNIRKILEEPPSSSSSSSSSSVVVTTGDTAVQIHEDDDVEEVAEEVVDGPEGEIMENKQDQQQQQGEEQEEEQQINNVNAESISSVRIPTITSDKKLAPMIEELTARVNLKRRIREDPNAERSIDEKEAKVIEEKQELRFMQFISSQCKVEQEGKCRCCFVGCNKLFRGVSFLAKHFKAKHDGFGSDQLVLDAEPYMRRRFDSETVEQRPLPPIELESVSGLELKTSRDILSKYLPGSVPVLTTPPPPPPPSLVLDNRRHSFESERYNNTDRFNDRSSRKRQTREEDRRPTMDTALPTSKNNDSEYVRPARNADLIAPRKMTSYVDVDAPKEQLVTIDHALLPPPKKRKFGGQSN